MHKEIYLPRILTIILLFMHSNADSVEKYLESLISERNSAISQVREVILKNLPDGYVETMNWGMICYEVPLEIYPDTYNKKPLMYAALASQKNHMAVYLSSIYNDESIRINFENEYKATGKKMDLGKSCVRFKSIEDLPLDVIGRAINAQDLDSFVLNTKENRRQ